VSFHPSIPSFRRSDIADPDKTRLEQPWIYEEPPPPLAESNVDEAPGPGLDGVQDSAPGYQTPPRENSGTGSNSTSSQVSLGDTHIWRE
jgi:hypothetical protein